MRTHSNRITTVDALRGIASVSVAWFHFTQANAALGPGILKSSGKYGWLGVDVFFVISGFVIPYSLNKAKYGHRQFWCFLSKRIVRLDPPYLANICFIIALAYVVPLVPGFHGSRPNFTITQLLFHFAYLNSVAGKTWINPVYWSLAIEFQYYLLVGLLFPVLAGSRAWIRMLTVGSLLVPGFFLPSVSLLFAHLPLFVAGILTFQFKSDRLTKGAFLAALAFDCVVTGLGRGPVIAATCVGTALLIAFVEFGGKTLTWLGLISYSLYLMHVPIGGKIIDLGERFAHGKTEVALVLAAATSGSILAAWVLYRAVELPSQRFSSRISYRPKPMHDPEDSIVSAAAA
jgi:peptidoglycan/LPS O-acetylase OafA/YrhL